MRPGKIGVASFNTGAAAGTHISRMKQLRTNWYFNYQLTPHSDDGSGGTEPEFVPMIYDAAAATSENVATAVATGATHLLTFNEPDWPTQADMTVEEALELWPTVLEARTAGMLIGSPATVFNPTTPGGWFADFWAGLDAGDRPDFICLHLYPTVASTLEAQVSLLTTRINQAHNTYGLPVWLTEWGLVNNGDTEPTLEQVEAFMRRGIVAMDGNSRLHRHSWFSLPYFAASGFASKTNLYDGSWNITSVGSAMRRAGNGVL